MEINQSLIQKFFHLGEKRDYCPKRIYAESIARTSDIDTASTRAGLFFET